MKYAETNGKKPFDWNWFLHKGSYTDDELLEAEELAHLWITCACGNLCDIIPRHINGAPKDYILYDLGMSFGEIIHKMYMAFREDDNDGDDQEFPHLLDDARQILKQIEIRSAYLIYKINNEKSRNNT